MSIIIFNVPSQEFKVTSGLIEINYENLRTGRKYIPLSRMGPSLGNQRILETIGWVSERCFACLKLWYGS